MDKRIGWYLVELERRLERELPKEQIVQISKEIESHLDESVQAELANGASEEDVVAVSIKKLGKPAKVADGFLSQQSSGRLARSGERMTLITAAVLGLTIALGPLIGMRAAGVEGWLVFAAAVTLVLLAVASAVSKRLRFVGLLSLCVPVGVLWMLGWSWAYFTLQSEYGYPLIYSRGQAQAELALLTRQQAEFSSALERARRAFGFSSQGEPFPQGSDLVSQAGFIAPDRLPDRTDYIYDPNAYVSWMKDWRDAEAVWRHNGPRFIAELHSAVATKRARVDALQQALTQPALSDWRFNVEPAAFIAAVYAVIVVSVHLTFYGIGRLFRAIGRARRLATSFASE